MKIIITGSEGQLGSALLKELHQYDLFPFYIHSHEITDIAIIQKIVDIKPNLVIHTAALTLTDECSREPRKAFQVNALGTQNVALACQKIGASLVYISTNEVFDGEKVEPYLEFDSPNPINTYGRSKLAGEHIVRSLVQEHYIIRTAWLYARSTGKRNVSIDLKQLGTEFSVERPAAAVPIRAAAG